MILGIFENWAQFLEVVGVWLAAIATFAAAYVALRVASQSSAQFVTVVARPMLEATRGVAGSINKVFFISATNRGMRPVTITSIGISCKYPSYNAILLEGMSGSSRIPVTLGDGESAGWRYPETRENGESWYKGLAEHFKDFNDLQVWLALRRLRFSVFTSLGNEFFAPRSKEFRKKLWEEIVEVRKTK